MEEEKEQESKRLENSAKSCLIMARKSVSAAQTQFEFIIGWNFPEKKGENKKEEHPKSMPDPLVVASKTWDCLSHDQRLELSGMRDKISIKKETRETLMLERKKEKTPEQLEEIRQLQERHNLREEEKDNQLFKARLEKETEKALLPASQKEYNFDFLQRRIRKDPLLRKCYLAIAAVQPERQDGIKEHSGVKHGSWINKKAELLDLKLIYKINIPELRKRWTDGLMKNPDFKPEWSEIEKKAMEKSRAWLEPQEEWKQKKFETRTHWFALTERGADEELMMVAKQAEAELLE